METQIQMLAPEDIDEGFLTRVRLWINEVLEVVTCRQMEKAMFKGRRNLW